MKISRPLILLSSIAICLTVSFFRNLSDAGTGDAHQPLSKVLPTP